MWIKSINHRKQKLVKNKFYQFGQSNKVTISIHNYCQTYEQNQQYVKTIAFINKIEHCCCQTLC